MRRRDFIVIGGRSILGVIAAESSSLIVRAGIRPREAGKYQVEPLYNGILPPTPFPPVRDEPWSTDEMPYYITDPPSVIRIDTGRQLFVDDFLVDSMVGLTRTFYQAEPYEGNPILSPTDEKVHTRVGSDGFAVRTQLACPFSDGVWWDPRAGRFRAWYLGGPNTLRLAESTDGLIWTRVGADGIVMTIPGERDSGTVWIDEADPDPAARYKMSFFAFADKRNWIFTSKDGLEWPPYDQPIFRSAYYSSNPDTPTGDRSTFFYNPFRKKWVWSLRDIRDRREYGGLEFHRMKRYQEGDDLLEAASRLDESGYWIEADSQDLEEAGPPNRPQLTIPQVYNVDGFAYESVMVFGLTILSSNAWENRSTGEAFPKRNEVYLAFSRDGFHMTRASGSDRKPFVGIGAPEAWNEGNVQTVGGGCVIVGEPEAETLRFFFSGRENELLEDGTLMRKGHLGFATLRRDGFASVDADMQEGMLTTRPLRFDHPDGFLFVNADMSGGALRAEILDENGLPVPGFERELCLPIESDSTKTGISWENRDSLADLSGVPFRLRFYLRSGRLFSFWISPTRAGASEGYLAAGGPSYESYRDTSPPDTSATDPDFGPDRFSIAVTPNPLRTSATVVFELPSAGAVSIDLYDVQGRAVRGILEGIRSAGQHSVTFDRSFLAEGVYFCRVRTNQYSDTVKIVILGQP